MSVLDTSNRPQQSADGEESNSFSFPSDLGVADTDYCMIRVFDVRGASDIFSQSQSTFVGDATLPMPMNYTVNYSASWSQENLGVAGTVMSGMRSETAQQLGSAMTGDNTVPLSDILSSFGGDNGAIINEMRRSAEFSVLGAVGINAGASSQNNRRFILNPHSVVLFQGMPHRTLPMSYSLRPHSQSEANQIRGMIKLLKTYMHPVKDSEFFAGHYIKYPGEYEIHFETGGSPNKMVPKFSRCALTSLMTDLTPDGDWSTYAEDGSPTSVTLTLNFMELKPLFRNDIEDGF